MKSILVLGSGVSGLSCAANLVAEGHKVTIRSLEAPGTFPRSSANAYAMWWPVADPAQPRLEGWADFTYAELAALASDPDAGVVMRKVMALKTKRETPWFAKLSVFRHANPGEISAQYADAHVLDAAPIVDPGVYLAWLYKKCTAAGVKFEQGGVASFADCPSEYDVLVNCTSLGSRTLAADSTLYPSRFQVVTIKHNGWDSVVFDDEGPNRRACVVPHKDYIKLGAVVDEHQEGTDTDPAATSDILRRCANMLPGFKADPADVLDVVRACRPERRTVRVEVEVVNGRKVVHNYGHDGMGYIISAGTAEEVRQLVNS